MSLNYSFAMSKEVFENDSSFWSETTPVSCDVIRIFGVFLCIAAFVGIICNGALVYSFVRYKALRSPPNVFITFIAGMGFLASCTLLPLTGTSSIYCRWLYRRAGCYMDAIIGFLYGCASSYLLCAVSISRCYIIVRPFKANKVTVRNCVIISSGVVLLSFAWTLLPLLGWNEYTMEVGRTSCCINWYDRRPSYISFVIVIFICIYCIPLVILVTTNFITMNGLKRMRSNIKRGIQSGLDRKRIEMERRILKSIIITTCGFFVTWTPYSVAVLVTIFGGLDYGTPPIITSICSIFAKSSALWIPLLHIGTSTQFRLRFVDRYAMNQHATSNAVAIEPTNAPALTRNSNEMKMAPVASKFVGRNSCAIIKSD